MMLEGSVEGQKANYLYGYTPKKTPIPSGWVKTMRPCMECNSGFTFIDENKVWHCMRCEWRSDMRKKFSEEEIALIAKGLEMGKTIKRIAEELDRDYGSVSNKIALMRKRGLLTPNAARAEAVGVAVCCPEPHNAPKPDPLVDAWQQAKGIGFELVSIRVSDGVATFTMSLKLGK